MTPPLVNLYPPTAAVYGARLDREERGCDPCQLVCRIIKLRPPTPEPKR